MTSLVAWILLPLLLLALCQGLGRLLERVTGVALADGLVAPVGACLAIALALTGYVVGLRGIATPLVLAALAVAGFALPIPGRPRLARPGWAALAWAGAYGLYVAPVVLTGSWTWTGYNFVNDTSVQLLLAEWLPAEGRRLPETYVSTTEDIVNQYLASGYPLGSHALLGAVGQLLPVQLAALYQPFISVFAGLATMALFVLARPLVGARWAVVAAFAAVASNLLYQYGLQGNMKEIVTVAVLATTAGVAGWSVARLRETPPAGRRRLLIGSAVLLAVAASAAVNVLSSAGAPYAGLIVGLWLILLLAWRLVPGLGGFLQAGLAGLVVAVVASAATLSKLLAFVYVTSGTYAAPAFANDLGHLARPLEVRQTAGIWLNADYRLPVTGIDATLTTVGVWLVAALAVVAIAYCAWRRNAQVLLFALPVVAIMLVVTPRVSPYADAKTFMLMAPGVTFLGALGAAAIGRHRAALGVPLAALVLGGVLLSDAFAYHGVRLAPVDRMQALRDIDERFAGEGPILFNEPEEFAKNLLDDTRLNVGAEAVTPAQTQLRVPQAFAYLYFDLDDQTLEYVESFPLIALRRSPSRSRPPSNYELAYVNDFYEVWRRTSAPAPTEHLPLQAIHRVSLEPGCRDIAALARRARAADEVLVASRAPTVVSLDTVASPRSPGWPPHPYRPNMVLTGTPGEAMAPVRVPESGRYRAWIAGSFGRPVAGWVDGRRIGEAVGVNNVGQWHEIGEVELERGTHTLRLTRPGGDLAPGDGFAGELGPLSLQRVEPHELVRVAPEDATGELCGQAWDWIERVPAGDGERRPARD